MYKVSVLVPVFGVELFIERCARSLFEQTYPNLEYVFVNDQTPDKSIVILTRLIEDYPNRKFFVKIINHENNRGLAAARNTALDNANGEFVCHVDSDDWLEPDAIELLVKKQMETGGDIVSGNMFIHDCQGVMEFVQPVYNSREQMLLMLFAPSHDHDIFRRIIRRSLYEDNHIRCIEGNNMAEDRYQMIQLCYYSNVISTIDSFVYHYNVNNCNSYTHQIQSDKRLFILEQSFNNWVGIRSFLFDKDKALFQGTTRYLVNCLQELMRLSIKHKRKDLYRSLVRYTYDNEDCMNMVGLKKEGIKNRFKHNYYYLLMRDYSRRLFHGC